MRVFILSFVSLLLMVAQAVGEESIPAFESVGEGLEFREVLLDKPRSISILQLRCDPAKVRFNLLLAGDLKGRPKSSRADKIAKSFGQKVVINSSYFGHQMEILGYAERLGNILNPQVAESGLFSAFFFWDGRRAGFKRKGESLPKDVPVLFQAGPRLVWDGATIEGLERKALANRTVLSVDEQRRVSIVVIGGFSKTTLSELPALLKAPVSEGGVSAVRALNLDGGSSTQFYLKSGSQERYLPGVKEVPVFLGVSAR